MARLLALTALSAILSVAHAQELSLNKVWIWKEEIQLQFESASGGYLVNVQRAKPKGRLRANILIFGDVNVLGTNDEWRQWLQTGFLDDNTPHYVFYADEDEFFGMETDFRKRLAENELPKHLKLKSRIKAVLEQSEFLVSPACQDVLY